MTDGDQKIDTRLARAGHFVDTETGAVVPPLHTSTTFARGDGYELTSEFLYGREGAPTVGLAESVIRDLEGAESALLFASGMSAAVTLLDTLRNGDRIVAPTVMYHGAQNWMRRLVERRGVDLTLFDAADPGGLQQAVELGPVALVWIESPVNPTWDVIDISRASETAHGADAILVVDSTVAPPVTTQALSLGADIVMHSATKYLNGHSDVIGGVLATKNQDARWGEIWEIRKQTGAILAPFESWLLMRGLRTLGVRYDRCSATALRIAQHFEGHPEIDACLYPGLESHPGHAVARRQMRRGFGGMLSLLVKGGGERAKNVATKLRFFTPATSLGGVESLVEHRASVEGPLSQVPKNLLRLSIGLEDPADLIADLEAAIAPG
jgi:cystathionine gamma-synthase